MDKSAGCCGGEDDPAEEVAALAAVGGPASGARTKGSGAVGSRGWADVDVEACLAACTATGCCGSLGSEEDTAP